MQRSMVTVVMLVAGLILLSIPASAQEMQESKGLPSIADFTQGMEKNEGYFTYYWNADTAELWLEIPADRWGQEFLYMTSLPRGIGSNDIGIDRGQIRGNSVVLF